MIIKVWVIIESGVLCRFSLVKSESTRLVEKFGVTWSRYTWQRG